MRSIVLSIFDLTGNMVRPWADAGFLCYCVDIQHPAGERREGNIVFVGADLLEWIPARYAPGNYAAAFAFPPCTDIAVSGARWFPGKGLHKLADAIKLFACAVQICEYTEAPYMIENPVSVIASHWRQADHSFDPCDYGDPYTKKTNLWTGGGFVMPPKIFPGDLFDPPTVVEPTEGSKMHLMPPSDDRANVRSATPMGFARAVFKANRPREVAA